MTFPVIIIFLVLCLWFVICLPLLELYYLESKLEGKLDKIYDMMILFMAQTFIVVAIVVFVSNGLNYEIIYYANKATQ